MQKTIEKIEHVVCTVLDAIIAVILGVMILIFVAQVVCRYALPDVTLWWAEDLCILGVLWITALGAPNAWLKKSNLVMDIISSWANKLFLKCSDIIIDIVGMLAGIGMAFAGKIAYSNNIGFVQSGLRYDESFRYVPIIVFGVGVAFAAFLTLLKLLAKKQKSDKEDN